MDGSDRFTSSAAGALRSGSITGRAGGDKSGQICDIVYTMDPPFFRSKYRVRSNITFLYLRQEWIPGNNRRSFICGEGRDPQIVSFMIRSGWHTYPLSLGSFEVFLYSNQTVIVKAKNL